MQMEPLDYKIDGQVFKGQIACDNSSEHKRPGILIAHTWRGRDSFVLDKAQELANMGYVGFAVDLYGDGKVAASDQEAVGLTKPLFIDRALLRKRIVAAYNALCEHPMVDTSRIGAIGYCFGGLTVIELLRSGVSLRGVVTFHAVLGSTLAGFKANLEPNAKKLNGSILLEHGHDDPLVSAEDIAALQKELTEADVDWQMHIYGHTSHAFTNPEASQPGMMMYNAKSSKRSWLAMTNYFEEQFQ